MTFWIFIWVFISVLIIGLFVWSLNTLLKQKKAWAAFAKRRELNYQDNGFMKAPAINGTLQGCDITIFVVTVPGEGRRGDSSRTALQVSMGGFPFKGAVGNDTYKPFIRELDVKTEIFPKEGKWHAPLEFLIDDKAAGEKYLTKDRAEALNKLGKIPDCALLFLCDRGEGYLRLETPDPHIDPAKLDSWARKVVQYADVLRV